MQSTIAVITPAEDFSLISQYEAKLGLNLTGSTLQASDDQIDLMVKWASSEIAVYCNRVFAQETVCETIRDFNYDDKIFLTRYPVTDINSVEENGVLLDATAYDIDVESGRLTKISGNWSEPIVVTYTGGYVLPKGAPPALQQAALLMTREAYYAATRGDATTRMVSHKETRVIYFDPNAKGGAGGGGAGANVGSPTRRAVNAMLQHFIRINV